MIFETLADIVIAIIAAVVLWQAIRWLARFLNWVQVSEIARQEAEAAAQRKAKPAIAAPRAQAGVPADHLVVIAAAVAACGYRVVHIEDAGAQAWAAEGRRMHQTSHRPH